jgi:hypothetical protein
MERLDSALVHHSHILRLQRPSILAGLEHAWGIHSALERVALPAEEVIGMRAVALLVTIAQEERVRTVLGPHGVELSCIPQSLVGYLRHAYGVRGRAWAGRLECLFHRAIHMRLMVGAIEVLAVPASSKS